jgi:hypothetical protein
MQFQLVNGAIPGIGEIVPPATFQKSREPFISKRLACFGFRFYQPLGVQGQPVAGMKCNRVLIVICKRNMPSGKLAPSPSYADTRDDHCFPEHRLNSIAG